MQLGLGRSRYLAPAEDGEVLLIPDWQQLVDATCASPWETEHSNVELLGRPLRDLRTSARRQVVDAATKATRRYAEVSKFAGDDRPLVLTGHQPDLFHPGVWLKNFAASELAAAVDGLAINLVIDVDSCRATAIQVPTGSVDHPRTVSVAFDGAARQTSWEERRFVDRTLWRSFGDRVSKALSSLVADPMIQDWWSDVADRADSSDAPGEALAQARHALELQWRRPSLQLPQSAVCRTEAFRWFACHLLANLPRFRLAHNEALAQYRREHRIRNAAHPARDLAEYDQWLEAPFWIWSRTDPVRRPLYVRDTGSELLLSDRGTFERRLPLTAEGSADQAVERIAEWESQGVKLRSRALITTMFARLAIADVFLHGIGGSKYDEATDALSDRFFGATPPPYATLSGTLRLPIPHLRSGDAEVRRCRQMLRELDFHPEAHLLLRSLSPDQRQTAERAIHQKSVWIATPKSMETAFERHRAIEHANATIGSLLSHRRRTAEAALIEAQRRARASAVLESRDYAFCLFPLDRLRKFLLDFPR